MFPIWQTALPILSRRPSILFSSASRSKISIRNTTASRFSSGGDEMVRFLEIEFYRSPDKPPARPCSPSRPTLNGHYSGSGLDGQGRRRRLGPLHFLCSLSLYHSVEPHKCSLACDDRKVTCRWPTKRQCSPQVGAPLFPLSHRPHNVNIFAPRAHLPPFLSFLIRNMLFPLVLFILLLILTRA